METEKMALLYTRKADRERLASMAAPLLLAAQAENGKFPHLGSGEGVKLKRSTKTGA
jgi:hypothetical protein